MLCHKIRKAEKKLFLLFLLIVSVSVLSCSGNSDDEPEGMAEEWSEEAESEEETEEETTEEETEEETIAEETFEEKTTEEETSEPSEQEDVSAALAERKDSESDSEDFSSSGKSSATGGSLHVSGSHLTDADGNVVQLRGISTHGLSWYPEYVNAACFSDLKSWGCNVVRLAMYTADYNGYCTGGSRESLKDLIQTGVDAATSCGMYVIIDWHILSDGNPLTYESEAVSFFTEMSSRYAGYDNILYEICNEPNGCSWSDIKSYAEAVIPAIRANDPDAVIIVGTPTWSQDVDQAAADPITGYDNIMYSLHFYAATHGEDLRNKMVSAANAGLPIFVTEFGICDASGNGGIDTASADAWIDAMDQCGISYVAWNLSNKDETSAIIRPDVTKTSGFTKEDLSESGKWVYALLNSSSSTVSAKTPETQSQTTAAAKTETQTQAQKETQAQKAAASDESSAVTLTDNDLSVSVVLDSSWESGDETFYLYRAAIKNTSGKTGGAWKFTVKFNESVRLNDGWNGNYSVNGSSLTISSMDYNGALATGDQTGDIGFIVSGSSNLKVK